MADTNNDLWLQLTAESDVPDESTPADLASVKELLSEHNEDGAAHADIRGLIQAVADRQTDEIKEYSSKREFPASGDTSVTIYVDVSTGNLYRYNTQTRAYESLAMDMLPSSVALDGVPTAPTARTGTNTTQIATTAFVQNEIAALRGQSEATTPVYYDGKTKAKLSLLGENGTIVTNVANGKVEQGSSDAVTGGQLWSAQQDMTNMAALASRNIAANTAEIEQLKKSVTTSVKGTNLNVILTEAEGARTFTLSIPTDGSVAEGETKFVTGDTVYAAVNEAKSFISGGDGIKITNGVISVDDTIATKEDVANIALSNTFKIVNGDHTAAMLGEAEGQPTYSINVRANGSVQKNDSRIITGGVVYEETRLEEDGNFVRENNTIAQNVKVLDSMLHTTKMQLDAIPEAVALAQNLNDLNARANALEKAEADDVAALTEEIDAIKEREAGYANVDLNNLSANGAQVIRDIVDASNIHIINGDHTTATFGTENGVPTYSINVRAAGKIQDNDGRLVTGKTVYNEVRPELDGTVVGRTLTAGENLSALDEAYSNMQNRVASLEEREYITYKPGSYIALDDTNTISVKVLGEVAEGSKGLVTGGEIAEAIQDSETKIGLLIKDVHDEMLDRLNESRTIGAGEGISVSNNTVSIDRQLLDKIDAAVSSENVYTKEEVDALIPEDKNTQYTLSKDDETNELILKTTDGDEVSRIQLAVDTDTRYSLEKVGNTIRLIPNDDPTQAIPIELDPDINTTYTFTLNEDKNLVVTPNDNSDPTVIPLSVELNKKVDREELEDYVAWTDISTEDNPNRDAIVLKNHDGIFGTTTKGSVELLAMVSKWDVADFGNAHMRTNLNTDNVVTVNDSQIVVTDKNLGEFIKAGDGIELTKETVTVDPTTGFTADIVTVNAKDTTYTAGNGIVISSDNKISVDNRTERRIVSANGNEALIFNESDGGGAKYTNIANNTIAFAGVNDGSGKVDVQLYALDKTTKTGTRININPSGAYYTVRNSMAFTAEDEIVTRRDLNAAAGTVAYSTFAEFPETGEAGKIYVDNEKNSMYRWDATEEKYVELQSNTINDCVTGIESNGDELQITKADNSVTAVPLHSSLTNEDIDTLF